MLITPAQCRAARALLNWSQPDLAKRCEMHVQTISAFESETGSPTKNTLFKIHAVLSNAGIDFYGEYGVNLSESKFFISDSYIGALKDVLQTLQKGEEVLFMRADDRRNSRIDEECLSEIGAAGIKMRALTSANNKNLRSDREYRILPEKYFVTTTLYVIYADKIALNLDYKDDARFITLKNKTFASAMRKQFEYWWDASKPVA
ncbi:MAG: hypothetical protein DI551_04375 [Micavibrio aeruginosavorus]|uniref:HTH cro/C1-type domain-containing protein n=1 Tax=Micavibrio aeruginosavorus TaxID=349221 RepID=A0A2W5MZX1_9BACT|nr:MAG: hypothetical protein DI551_04375 [Micavibrio aeruginosavorus]